MSSKSFLECEIPYAARYRTATVCARPRKEGGIPVLVSRGQVKYVDMSVIPAPGVAQGRVVGKVGPNNWAVVLHWFAGIAAPWTQAQITALATSIGSHFSTNMLGQFTSTITWTFADAVDLSDSTQRASATPPGSFPGTGASTILNLGSCVMVSNHIGARYRGGHPRTYWPSGSVQDASAGDTWTGAKVSAFGQAQDLFHAGIITDLAAAGLPNAYLCVPRYLYSYTPDNNKHKFIKARTGYLGQLPVTNRVVSNQIRTQRRRLGK